MEDFARQEVWRCTREKGAPDKCVRCLQDVYEGARTQVKSSACITDKMPVDLL